MKTKHNCPPPLMMLMLLLLMMILLMMMMTVTARSVLKLMSSADVHQLSPT
jgi:hypothetical protein